MGWRWGLEYNPHGSPGAMAHAHPNAGRLEGTAETTPDSP